MAGKVLVVDDDWWVAELLEGLLREAGYAARSARGGEAALASIALDPPDLVLSDVRMPGLDGPGLARQLRDRGLGMPVLLFCDRTAAPPVVNLPGVRFVPKPFVPHRLVAAVEATLAPAREADGRADRPPDQTLADVACDDLGVLGGQRSGGLPDDAGGGQAASPRDGFERLLVGWYAYRLGS